MSGGNDNQIEPKARFALSSRTFEGAMGVSPDFIKSVEPIAPGFGQLIVEMDAKTA